MTSNVLLANVTALHCVIHEETCAQTLNTSHAMHTAMQIANVIPAAANVRLIPLWRRLMNNTQN